MGHREETHAYYEKMANSFTRDTRELDFSVIQDAFLEELFRAFPDGESLKVLDLGCGPGRDLLYFCEKGLEPEGLDGSETFAAMAREHSGCPVRCMDFLELEDFERWQGVFACASILHLEREEIPGMFERIYRALVPGGVFYTSFKEGEFSGMRRGRLFTDFTEEALRELLREFPGFEIVKLWETSDVRPGREDEKWLNVLLRKES